MRRRRPTSPARSRTSQGSRKKKEERTNKKIRKTETLDHRKAERYISFFTAVKNLKQKDFQTIIHYLNDEACNLLSECIHNSLCNNSIPSTQRKKLREILWDKRGVLRYIAKSSNNIHRKRKLMPQLGGNIGLIISAVLPILMRLFSKKR